MTASAWDAPVPIGNTKVTRPDGSIVIEHVCLPIELPTLLAGATNAGKSGVQHAFLAGLVNRPLIQIVILDPKEMEFPVSQWGPRAASIASGIAACKRQLFRLYNLKEHRKKVCKAKRLKKWVPTPDEPWIVVVFDEMAELLYKASPSLIAVFQSLIATVRATGIFFLNATQRPDTEVLAGTIRDNHRVRIGLGMESRDGARMIFGPDGADIPLHQIPETLPGVGYVRINRRFTKFRSFYIPEERLEQVIESSAHLRRDLDGFPAEDEDSDPIPLTDDLAPKRGRKTASAGRS